MKIVEDDYARLSAEVSAADTDELRERYIAGDFPRSDAVKDLDRRYRWDLFWFAGGLLNLEGHYNDAHIDTALRMIVPPLNKREKS